VKSPNGTISANCGIVVLKLISRGRRMKILVLFYSMYGHVHKMAEAVAEGAREVEGTDVALYQVPELVPDDALERTGARAERDVFAHIPVADPEDLADADGIVFGTPTRFGNMSAQMRSFMDRTGKLWDRGALAGKPAGVFTSSSTQHGGQETTITSFHSTLLHHGMIIVGVPPTEPGLGVSDQITGGSYYGASTIAAPDGSRQPSENELSIARHQGRRVTEIARALARERGDTVTR
jgi:NAD(P)H dehydrogenase (quinone)